MMRTVFIKHPRNITRKPLMKVTLIGTCLAGVFILLLNLSVSAAAQTQPASSRAPDKTSGKASVEELAKLKQNPVSGLRQLLVDVVVSPDSGGSGETEGVYSLQLVWPFSLNEDWKLITYTILPLAQLPDASGGDSVVGLSNTLINLFVSPKKPGAIIWGVGPAILLPTRTDPSLGSDHPGLGPALVLFYEKNEWSGGVVAQNVWSLGGSGIDEVNEFSAQYIFNYNLPRGWFLYSNATITADWVEHSDDRWTVPVGGGFGKVFNIGNQSMSAALQGFSNVVTPEGGSKWALNFQFALLFP